VTITNDGLPENEDPFRKVDPPGAGEAVPTSAEMPGLLPEDFWKKRPLFEQIRDTAHARRCSADVAFWATMTRFSGMISHRIRLDSGVGKLASLNLFAAVVGPPGAGKSSSAELAFDIMSAPDDFLDGLPIGTGEGMCEIYMGEELRGTGKYNAKREEIMKLVRLQVAHNAYFYVDEGAVLTQNGSKSASVLMETIRSAAIGGSIGQTNASADRKRLIKRGQYAMGMLIGYQETTALPMLADADGGTPQRLFWSWVLDPNIPKERPKYKPKITDHLGLWRPESDVVIEFPRWIQDEIDEELQARRSGAKEIDILDGHSPLMKVKAAGNLALLDKRKKIKDEDWEIADLLWANSCLVRNSLVARARQEAEAVRKAQEDAQVSVATRIHEATAGADRRLESLANRVRTYVADAGVGGITWGALRKKLASSERPLLEKAIELAEGRGWIVQHDDRLCIPTDA
jgi:hypothetical protein